MSHISVQLLYPRFEKVRAILDLDCQFVCHNFILAQYLVNINVYTKFGKILSICSQDIERNEIMTDRMTDNPNPV